ncbi:hypothetical protein K488DRAFT_36421, partial [Vararia minispora EC-137]
VVLEDVTPEELDPLVSILYPSSFDEEDIRSQADWSNVLKLSTRWSFRSIRALAIRRLEPMLSSPLDRLALARSYDVAHWVEPALFELVLREKSLNTAEVARMTHSDTAFVAMAREALR